MIEVSQRILKISSKGTLGGVDVGGALSPAMKRHLELEIETLQNAPRNAEKLERLLQAKRRQKDEAQHIEETRRLVAEIEMLKIVLYLVSRRNSESKRGKK
jgi:hypothetical protein